MSKITQYTKREVASHIYDIFARRPETLRTTRWACVIKEGKLMVVRRLSVMPTDPVIVECVLEPSELPSWISIYWGVRTNWRKIGTAKIEI
jgi:hypothetical protein